MSKHRGAAGFVVVVKDPLGSTIHGPWRDRATAKETAGRWDRELERQYPDDASRPRMLHLKTAAARDAAWKPAPETTHTEARSY